MTSTNYLDNDNQTSLLFKQFQNVVQTGIDTGFGKTTFSAEGARSLKNVFNDTIFRNDVDASLNPIYYCKALTNGKAGSPDISSSVWDSSTNNILDQTYYPFQIPGTNLTYYKDIYLKPVQGTLNAWYFPTTTDETTDVNLLKNMIPFNYNPIKKDAFTPIVKYYNGTEWIKQGQNDIGGLNWLVDYESGVLELYQINTILQSSPYQLNLTASDEFGRLRISCICYTGQMGITGSGGGGSGLINVGDISNGVPGTTQDVSAIYFDVDGFDLSFNSNTVTVTNLGSTGGGSGSGDLSYSFFDIPRPPTDGSGYLDENLGSGTIILNWTNPVNYQAALPFGKYTTYPDGTNTETLVDIQRLPFHRHLHIEFLQYSAGVPDNNPSLNSSWIDLSINKTNQKVLPNTLTEAYLTANDGSSTVDLCGNPTDVNNAPYERAFFGLLELGKGYQFRIYQDNSGTTDPIGYPVTDPVYGQDVSWNYLYIPSASGDYIELGSFGPAIAPDGAQITNSSYNEFDVNLSTTNNADISLNTPFPINPNLNLEYAFGVGISGEVDVSSQQMPNVRYDTLFSGNYPFNNSDISSAFQRQNNVTLDYTLLASDLSACPQFKYTLSNLYGVNSAFPNDLSYNLDISDTKILPKPTRTQAILSGNSEWRNTLTTNSEVNGSDINRINTTGYISELNANPAVPDALNASTLEVIFLDTSGNYDGEVLNNTPNGDLFVANNFSNNLLGIDSSGEECSYLNANVINSSVQGDTSNNSTIGYLDISSSDLSNSDFLIQSKVFEAGKTPNFQNKGYYTGLNITNLTINNINLSKYPDISNNSYNPYEFRIQHYYNDPATVGGSVNWSTSGNYKFKKFYIGKRPDGPIQYTLNGYNYPSPLQNNYLMGLIRPNPSSDILIDYSYNLFDIDPTWASSTITSIGGLSKTSLYYEPDTLGTGQIVGSSFTSTYPNDGKTSKDIIPGLQIPTKFYTTTKNYSRTYDTGPQFAIEGKHINNVSYMPDPSNIPQQDIAFGILNQRLWWDYTWEGSGIQAVSISLLSGFNNIDSMNYLGGKLDPGTSTYPLNTSSNPGGFFITYDHQYIPTYNQLIWANGAFRSGQTSTLTDNPYIDFSSNYYNPNSTELKDYSIFDNSGDDVSYNIAGGEYYDKIVVNSVHVSGNYKWINLKIIDIENPYLDITVTGGITGTNPSTLSRGSNSQSGDYLLFICEENNLYQTTTGYAYNGRSGWLDTQKTKTTASLPASALDGAGCFDVIPTTPLISLIQASSTDKSTVYLMIGLSKNSNKYISGVTFTSSS